MRGIEAVKIQKTTATTTAAAAAAAARARAIAAATATLRTIRSLLSSRDIEQQPLITLTCAPVMALVYEKTWSQRYIGEQGVTWQLTDLEAYAGEVFERWQVLPPDEEPHTLREGTDQDKDEPTGDDKDEPRGHDDNEEPPRKVPRLSSVTFYGDAA